MISHGDKRIFFLTLVCMLLLRAATTTAEGITGSVELLQSKTTINTTDESGMSSGSELDNFRQRYTFLINNQFSPSLYLRGGLRVEQEKVNSEAAGNETEAKNTKIMPSVSFAVNNPVLFGGAGWDRRDEKQEAGGGSVTYIRENKNASLSFRPVGLPTLNLLYTQSDYFDRQRILRDRSDNTFSANTLYSPVKGLDLSYQANYTETENRLNASESDARILSGRAGYSRAFFNNRAFFSAAYRSSRQEISTSRTTEAVLIRRFPIEGIWAIDDTPEQGALNQNTALIDGIKSGNTGINIGLLRTLAGDSRKRNVGVDFGIETAVSSLFVWIDKSIPAAAAASFLWEIYVSADNQNWSLHHTVFPAAFDQLGDNRFEIRFPEVKARYIKATTRPLSAAVAASLDPESVNDINLTEVEAFSERSGTASSMVTTSDAIDVNTRVTLAEGESYSVFHNLYYQHHEIRQADMSVSSGILTNALIGNKRFSRAVSGNARIMRQNDDRTDGTELGYTIYDASLTAITNSLPRMNHTMVLTGRREDYGRSTIDSGTIFLNNIAEVYPGIDAMLSGGHNLQSSSSGTRTASSKLTAGAAIVPHRAVTLNLNYDRTSSEQSGSGMDVSTDTEVTTGTASYNPFSNLYLLASISTLSQTGEERRRIRNYSISWSEQQRNGALQITFTYNESIQPDEQTSSRVIGPALRWRINMRTFFDASYYLTDYKAGEQVAKGRTLNSGLKLNF